MERVLEGLHWKSALAYLDAIIVFKDTFEEELEQLREVLCWLRDAILKSQQVPHFPARGAILGAHSWVRRGEDGTTEGGGSAGLARPHQCGKGSQLSWSLLLLLLLCPKVHQDCLFSPPFHQERGML